MRKNPEEWEIVIPLPKVRQSEVTTKEEYFKIIEASYTTQYLKALGVEPTDKHRRTVAHHFPLEKCHIETEWDGDSVIARQLRITPARTAKTNAESSGASRKDVVDDSDIDRLISEYQMSTELPPDSVTHSILGARRPATSKRPGTGSDSEQAALVAMQMKDLLASQSSNASLTHELEGLRQHARGDSNTPVDVPFIHWGEEGRQELNSLKRRFILPFAAEKRPRGNHGPVEIVPWQSLDLQANSNIDVSEELRDDMSRPVEMTLSIIQAEAIDYVGQRFPLELLTTRVDPWLFVAIRERLRCPEAIRLTGLLAHLFYWRCFAYLHHSSERLPAKTHQSLVLTIQELWSRLIEPARERLGRRGELLSKDAPSGITFVTAAFLLAIKRGTEHVFLTQYVRTFTNTDHGATLREQLVDQINVMAMNLFDPDCTQASFGALDSSVEAIQIWRKLHVMQMKLGLTAATRMLNREFRTTPAVLLLMNADGGGPRAPKTRKLLQKSKSDAVLRTATGAPASSETGLAATSTSRLRPGLNEQQKAVLYRTARNRLASSGLDQLSSMAPSING